MKSFLRNFLALFLILSANFYGFSQQKIGLVLSGGGATGFAHIGILQALEEKGIPIDYIAGTSAGALVGGLYAAGYSPQEIKNFCSDKSFLLMATGELRRNQEYFFKEDDQKSSMFTFPFSLDSLLQKSLPTNFTNSTFLDYELMRILGPASAINGGKFDNLFVPFRCLASDIVSKENVVFSSGYLNEAIRASMTFPFYFQPLRINGRLLFDGGLYNNFPANVLYQEFSPDYIIGSNVSYNAKEPQEYDLISQIENMLVRYSNFELPCEEGIIIEPKLAISTFDFNDVQTAIEVGYQTGLLYADSILMHLDRTISPEEVQKKRVQFRSKIPDLVIGKITNVNNSKLDFFVQQSILHPRKRKVLSSEEIEQKYYQLAATDQLSFLFPTLDSNALGNYDMNITVRKKNEFKFDVGGVVSSRPINTGYIGLTYYHLRKSAIKLHAESYFGKFYGSINLSAKIEFPGRVPLGFEPYFTMNRWDYFRSFTSFFEDVRPSFLIQNEMYYGLKFYHPIANNSKSTLDIRAFNLEDEYYQTNNFTAQDTSDNTRFIGQTASWKIEHNSLDRKQFASSGHLFSFQARYISGQENTISGTTSSAPDQQKRHSWINLNVELQTFPVQIGKFHLGVQGRGVFNSQSLFGNYTATLLNLTSFKIIPDAETYFLPEYISPFFLGGGLNTIYTIKKNIDIRADLFYFQPLTQLVETGGGNFSYSKPFKGESILASGSVIYHSFLGPLRATVNYFPKQMNNAFNFQVSFGYILFNERAIR